ISSAVCTGLGVAPSKIGEVIGVTKAYCTRVGGGPFPTELFDETGAKLAKVGNEFGAVTGRPRRCGWIDLVALNYTCMLSGVTQLVMTKADVLDEFDSLKACTAYKVDGKQTEHLPYSLEGDVEPVYTEFDAWEEPSAAAESFSTLPDEMLSYLTFVEKYLNTPVQFVSTGPGRDQILVK
ncbi:MAG TPA: adenylosuccinate synthetase, partial [Chitinophagaceae bacterium]|nr:adenylosuccinate synthetase [Chitinophagaceae bacterium]